MRYALTAAILLAASTAYAEPSKPDHLGWASARGAAWGVKEILTTAGTPEMVKTSTDAGTRTACIAYDELVTVKADDGNAICC